MLGLGPKKGCKFGGWDQGGFSRRSRRTCHQSESRGIGGIGTGRISTHGSEIQLSGVIGNPEGEAGVGGHDARGIRHHNIGPVGWEPWISAGLAQGNPAIGGRGGGGGQKCVGQNGAVVGIYLGDKGKRICVRIRGVGGDLGMGGEVAADIVPLARANPTISDGIQNGSLAGG